MIRQRFWRWLLGPLAWEGAVRHLKEELWRAARDGSNPAKVTAELARLGIERGEAEEVLALGRRLPTDPCQTVVFVDGHLIGYTTNWRIVANPGLPNALSIEVTTRP